MSLIDESYMDTYTSTLSYYYLRTLHHDTISGSTQDGYEGAVEVYIPTYDTCTNVSDFFACLLLNKIAISSTNYTYYPATGVNHKNSDGDSDYYGVVYAIRALSAKFYVCYVDETGTAYKVSLFTSDCDLHSSNTITLNEGSTSSTTGTSSSLIDEDYMTSYTESLQQKLRGLYLNVFVMEGTLASGKTGAVQFTIPTLHLYDITTSEGRYKIFTSGYEADSGSSKGNTKFITASGGVVYNSKFWIAHSAYMPSGTDGIYRVSFSQIDSQNTDPITVDISYNATFSGLSTIKAAYRNNSIRGD